MGIIDYRTNLGEVRQICEEFNNSRSIDQNSVDLAQVVEDFHSFVKHRFQISIDTFQINVGHKDYKPEHKEGLLLLSAGYLFEEHFRIEAKSAINEMFAFDACNIIREVVLNAASS